MSISMVDEMHPCSYRSPSLGTVLFFPQPSNYISLNFDSGSGDNVSSITLLAIIALAPLSWIISCSATIWLCNDLYFYAGCPTKIGTADLGPSSHYNILDYVSQHERQFF